MSNETPARSIVFVLGRFGRGGAERVVSRLVRSYADDGWSVTIVTLLGGGEGYPLPPAATLVDLSQADSGSPAILRWPLRLLALRRLIVQRQARVVVAMMAPINVVTLVATWKLRCAVIVSERSDPLRDRRSPVVRLMTHRLYPKAHLVIFQTEYARQLFPEVPSAKTAVLPNPVTIGQAADENRRPLIVSVGRLAPEKNHAMLVRAFAHVVQKHPEYRLMILGDGPLRAEITSLIMSLRLTGLVDLPGESSTVHADISEATCFVLSSDYEGFSNALIEAMRMGIFCISTDCAGARELIHEGVNGRLVPRGDDAALAKVLLEVIENPELRARVEAEGVKSCERFDSGVVLQSWKSEIARASRAVTEGGRGL